VSDDILETFLAAQLEVAIPLFTKATGDQLDQHLLWPAIGLKHAPRRLFKSAGLDGLRNQ
jgi:hypothetical protein